MTLQNNWKNFTVTSKNSLNVYLNVLITLPTAWNELPDNKKGEPFFQSGLSNSRMSCLQ